MNLLSKDKYRTKIMEQLLHQYENQQSSVDQDNNEIFSNIQTANFQNDNIYSRSMIFEKVSKQKALICDGQTTQREIKKHLTKEKSVNLIRFKQNHTQNITSQAKKEKQFFKVSSQNIENKIPQIQRKGHLKKQSFIYHQKLPLMQISQPQNNQILKKLKRNVKLKSFDEDKQNNSKKLNSLQATQSKEKKYRFIVANKVAEALKSKRQAEIQDHAQAVQISQEYKNEVEAFNETYRSKGSKQMLEFLETAKQKLFLNTKIQKSQVQKPFDQKQTEIKTIIQIDQKNQKTSVPKENRLQINKTFKIQIQVSANKTCQIELTLNSDPKNIAREFIESNKSQLKSFKDLQIQKLQELLSIKISLQLQKQRKLLKSKTQRQVYEKYQNIINFAGVNEMLLKDDQQDRSGSKFTNTKIQSKSDIKRQKKIQFSHVYIDLPVTNLDQLNQSRRKNLMQNVSPKTKKNISFNPKHQSYDFEGQSQQENNLEGYFNSPHQLITYRHEDSPQNVSDQSQTQDNQVKCTHQAEDIFSHFPLSASFAQIQKRTILQDKALNEKTKESQSPIGAAKILSRSRQKLIKFRQQKHEIKIIQEQQCSNVILNNQNQETIHNSVPQQFVIQATTIFTTVPTINNISQKIVSRLGKQNILNSLKQRQISKRQKILKQKEQKKVEEMKECSFRPKINNLSKSIDKNKKEKIKISHLLGNDTLNGNQQMDAFSIIDNNFTSVNQFKKMNQTSKFDKILSKLQKPQQRYQQLYNNHKVIEAKKQFNRQKSMEQISFKPQINRISRKIIQTKRNSLSNSVCQQLYSLSNSKVSLNRHHSTCKKPNGKNSFSYSNEFYCEKNDTQHINKNRKSLNVSRNLEGLQIGDYLYKEAMKMKKKRQSQPMNKIQNFKPLQKSQRIMSKLKEKRLSEYFTELIHNSESNGNVQQDQQIVLTPSIINLEEQRFLHPPHRYLVPLLEELKQLNVSLTRDEFIESGLKLFNFLSQDEKAEFMNNKQSNQENKQNLQHQPSINKFSQQIIEKKQYYLQDIYQRGLLYKKSVNNKIETDFQNKVRTQLEKCTFKPKINNLYQTVL